MELKDKPVVEEPTEDILQESGDTQAKKKRKRNKNKNKAESDTANVDKVDEAVEESKETPADQSDEEGL